ncbi:MAG: STAS domain-containing protein [Bacteroidia bacterium]
MSFSFKINENNKLAIIALKGRMMDIDAPKQVNEQVAILIEKGTNHVILNLSELEYMNSSGINMFVSILTKARNNGGDAVICCVSKKIEQLLLITKLNSVFTITASEEEAISKLSENISA